MAANKVAPNTVAHECQYKCNSERHASYLTAALTKLSLTDEQVAAYLKWCCVRYHKAVDSNGRTLLHLAASVGRPKLLEYFLKHRGIDINEKDKESHYTPLHRSLFYGNIDCAIRLIEHGANIDQLDLDSFTPFDHVIEDVSFYNHKFLHEPIDANFKKYEVYVWGSNTNYTLGIGNHQSRANPEPLECFRRRKIEITEVVMSKFHSAFVDINGELWTCGHGQGGRLGLRNELTVLTPKKVISKEHWEMVALGTDHTLALGKSSFVYSFGLNTYHQLGHSPPPEKVLNPKKIKSLSGSLIIGIKASKYHSVFWTETKLYTCGLNGGQLGHPKSSRDTIIVPKAVHVQGKIKLVATSDSATVFVTDLNDTYLLYDYQCKKISIGSRLFHPKMIRVIGGRLDHEINSEIFKEKGGDLLQILLVTKNNSVYLWQENGNGYFHCDPGLRRKIEIIDIALNKNSVLFVFRNGMAFEGEIKISERKSNPDNRQANLESVKGHIKLKRIPFVQRGLKIACDVEGRNFAFIQIYPSIPEIDFLELPSDTVAKDMEKLFYNLEKKDYFQDVTFEVEEHRYLAHRYVVAYSSKVLEEMMNEKFQSDGVCVVKIKNMKSHIFLKLLYFMYTGKFCYCDPSISLKCSYCDENHERETLAFNHNNKRQSVLNLLKLAADTYKITTLQHMLEKKFPFHFNRTFERNALFYLWDIIIKSRDGIEYKAHKFILASRSEYFNVFINRWLDNTEGAIINLPIPGKIVNALLNYFYTGSSVDITITEDLDFLILTYIIAHQLLCHDLIKKIAYTLTHMLTLENIAEILHLASFYDDQNLKMNSMQFICLNLLPILEYRILEDLPDSMLSELTEYYKDNISRSNCRQITPYYNAPDDKLVSLISKTEPVSLDSVEEEYSVKLSSRTPKKRNRKSRRTRNTSSDSLTSEEEPEPLTINDFNNFTDKDEESWVKVVHHTPKQQKSVQTTIRTPVEISKIINSPKEADKFVCLNRTQDGKNNQNLEKKFYPLNTSSEEEFPALNASPVQKAVCLNPQTPRASPKIYDKIVKLSQKQRKKLSQSLREVEETAVENEIKSPWGTSKTETLQLVDIMKEEKRRRGSINQRSMINRNPPWRSTVQPETNLSDVMESEQKSMELIRKMRAVEDKAIKDLLLFYNEKNVTDERITVIRASQYFVFLPV